MKKFVTKFAETSWKLPSLWKGKKVVKKQCGAHLPSCLCCPPEHSLLGLMHFFQLNPVRALQELGSLKEPWIGS